ncbi:MAG TPA: MIP/aquaporin family protein [Candidatus Acidoferrales bacterium]|nr:MIP/aquaporin family protein [Candidatus Acidoferrales bacterium]
MASPMLGEFMGTLVLVLLGNGVIADVVLGRSKGEGGGWMSVATGWGFAAMAGIFTANACGSRDAHINPAITLGLAIATHDSSKLVPYITAQMLGGFVGAVLVWLHFLPHWKETPDPMHKLGCFCSYPAIPNVKTNLLSEIIPTFTLAFGAVCIFSRTSLSGATGGSLAPFLIGGLVWGVILSMAGPTGTSMNPARDLSSRIAHAILPIAGKGSSDWGYAPISLIGTLAGGALAGVAVHLLHII